MDSGMWHMLGKIDFMHSPHKWLPTMLSCGWHGSALSTGFIPRLRLCWRPWGLEINLGGSPMYLRKSNICPHQLDVQEANFSIPQFHRVRNHFFGYWIAHGIFALDLWDVVIEVLSSTNNTARPGRLAQGNLCKTGDHSSNKTKTKTQTEKSKREVEQVSIVDYVPTNTQSSEGESHAHCWRQGSCHQDVYQRTKSNTETRVQNPQSCAWLVVQQNQLGTEDPNQICGHQKPTRWHGFTRDEWNHLLRLFSIMSFSMFSCSHFSNFLSDPIGMQSAVSKRGQEATSSEGSTMAKPKALWFQRRRDPSTWCDAVRGARGKIPRRIWDTRSTRWMPTKDKAVKLVQGNLYGPPKAQKSRVLKWGERKCSTFRFLWYKETCTGSDP